METELKAKVVQVAEAVKIIFFFHSILSSLRSLNVVQNCFRMPNNQWEKRDATYQRVIWNPLSMLFTVSLTKNTTQKTETYI